MKVITVDNQELDRLCRQLDHEIRESSFRPEIILGVKSGGVPIAERLDFLMKPPYPMVVCHPVRKMSKNKKRYFNKILKLFPLTVLNFLRQLEAILFFHTIRRKQFIKIELPKNIREVKNILIVDDAVDTGNTLSYISTGIHKINPEANMKFAVITVTKSNPLIQPDFSIFKNTLVRFPWSLDAK